jgi:hypothetical protein
MRCDLKVLVGSKSEYEDFKLTSWGSGGFVFVRRSAYPLEWMPRSHGADILAWNQLWLSRNHVISIGSKDWILYVSITFIAW